MKQTVLDAIDKQRDSLIDLQRQLVAIPALGPDNGGKGENEKADFLIEYLQKLGCNNITELNAPDDRAEAGYRPNILAMVPGTDLDRTLWVIGHMDIVPAGERELWDSDPFELRVEGDEMFGRGVEDDHAGIVPPLMLAKALLENDITPNFNLGLIFVADEETGSKYGLGHVVEEHSDYFGENDLFVIPDMGAEDSSMIEIAEKSSLWIKVGVIGKQCHASTPLDGVNSLVAASAFILRVNELYDEYPDEDDLFEPAVSTFEPTKKDANVPNINTIAGKDVFYIDSRVLPHYSLLDVVESIKTIGADIELEYGVKCEYDVLQIEQAAPATPADAEVVTRLSKAVKTVYGTDCKPVGIGGGTVAAFLRRKGFGAAAWATMIGNPHQPNEKALISHQLGDAKVLTEMLFTD